MPDKNVDESGDKIDLGDMAALLHSGFFAFERAHGELIGSGSKAILRYVVRDLPGILEARGDSLIDENRSLDENLEAVVDYFSNPEHFKDVSIERDGDRFEFRIGECQLARTGVHEVLSEKNTCPFAIIIASILYQLTGENVSIHDSEYTEYGNCTVLELV